MSGVELGFDFCIYIAAFYRQIRQAFFKQSKVINPDNRRMLYRQSFNNLIKESPNPNSQAINKSHSTPIEIITKIL